MAKVIIFCAPSGSGKSTIIGSLMPREELHLAFSVSATTRAPRGKEKHGVEYLFLSDEEFRSHIANHDFIEYEEVYPGCIYGTLKAQVDKQLAAGQNVVFDVDVHGGMRLKEYFGERAMSIFIQPPSLEVLRKRLEGRATDTQDVIEKRMARANYELTFAPRFDRIVVNDELDKAQHDAYEAVAAFIAS